MIVVDAYALVDAIMGWRSEQIRERLAESMNIPLITRDARLSRSSGHAARIEYIA